MKLMLGGASTTELLGLSPIGAIVVETDGSIEQSDILKSAFQGASVTGLHVSRDSFDSALCPPLVHHAGRSAIMRSAIRAETVQYTGFAAEACTRIATARTTASRIHRSIARIYSE